MFTFDLAKFAPSKLAWLLLGGFLCTIMGSIVFNKPLNAATATAAVTANIIITMSLSSQGNMAFGDISASSNSGSVILNTEGKRSSTGGTTINSAEPGRVAAFSATGEPGATVSISMPTSVQLINPSNNTMIVDNFTSNPNNIGQLDTSGNMLVAVGATLHVNSGQAFGSYTGLMTLDVNYN